MDAMRARRTSAIRAAPGWTPTSSSGCARSGGDPQGARQAADRTRRPIPTWKSSPRRGPENSGQGRPPDLPQHGWRAAPPITNSPALDGGSLDAGKAIAETMRHDALLAPQTDKTMARRAHRRLRPRPPKEGNHAMSQRQDRRRHRLDLRHRPRLCARLRRAKAPTSSSTASARRRDRERARRDRERVRRQGRLSPADMTKPDEIAAMIARGEKHVRRGRHPRQQCRHPARLADRGVPGRQMGRRSSRSTCRPPSTHPRRGARHEGARLGPDHHHRLGAFPRRLAQQVRLCHGQARHRRPDQDRGAGRSRPTGSRSTASAPAMSGRRSSRSRFPTR